MFKLDFPATKKLVLEEKPLYQRIVVVVFYRLQQKNTKYSQEKSKKVKENVP